MLNSPLRTFEHKYFYSIIDRDDPESLPDFFAYNIENWLIRDRLQLVMRPGLTATGTSPNATNLGAIVYNKSTGTKKWLRVINGAANSSKFQDSTDGITWSDVSGGGSKSTDKPWRFVQANDAIYGVNGYDTSIKYDGSTVSTVAGIPLGTAIDWWKNHLWVTGVLATPDRLYYSNLADPETFGGSAYINVSVGDESKCVGIQGLGGSSGRLIVGKERSVWYVTGSSSSDWALQPLTYEHGIASPESMIPVKNDVWGIDMEGNIRSIYRSTDDSPFSSIKSGEIQYTISNINKAALQNSSAVWFNNYAMFFMPYGVDSKNSIVLVWDVLANNGEGGWVKFTNWNIARAVVYSGSSPTLYLFDSRAGNGQTYTWSGTSDNGVAITAKYETKIMHHGAPERKKVWKFAYQFAPTLGTVPVKFYTSTDRYYYQLVKTFNLTGTGDAEWDTAVWDTDMWSSEGTVREQINLTDGGATNDGYTIQVKLEAQSSTTQVKIRNFTLHYRYLGLG
jgi:hypothetical protein